MSKKRRRNGAGRIVRPPKVKNGEQKFGISVEVGECLKCKDPVRMAATPGGDVAINPMPMQFILSDGHILPLFVPHTNTCGLPRQGQVPPSAIIKPGDPGYGVPS